MVSLCQQKLSILPPSVALLLGQPENKEHLDKFKITNAL
jgi:hypothetical protein